MSKLSIKGYPDFVNGDVSGFAVATFTLQLNPEEFSIGYDTEVEQLGEGEAGTASGVPVSNRSRAYTKQKLSIDFLVDNTGILPNAPTGLTLFSIGGSISDTIDTLYKATIKPTSDSHMPPFVHVEWGSAIDLKGKATDLDIQYTRFNSSGDPIRAKVKLTVLEEVDETVISRQFQSPDITRMPTIREGDTLVAMCNQFYDDPSYFIQVANLNNLPNFRRLKVGSVIRFPPLEK
ncbi:MAG: hypothetical protein FJX89_06730 [Bacteroidetes bacterium]|nr:hypothetical protein [Bacteroidota bacterium]